jgi:hypothetical protein
MPLYRLYGLRIFSPWRLSSPAVEGSQVPDVVIEAATEAAFATVDAAIRKDGNDPAQFRYQQLQDGGHYVRWGSEFEFLVERHGKRVLARRFPNARLDSLRVYLLSQALSFSLLERGVEPLHATVVADAGRAVGFMGAPGMGKSTLAAEFLRAGAKVVTDDLLVVDRAGTGFVAQPGPPRIKLSPEVARRLLGKGTVDGQVTAASPKSVIPLGEGTWRADPVRLDRLYVLQVSHAATRRVSIRGVSERRGFLELTRNTFNPVVVTPARLQRQFKAASILASSLSVKTISYPRDLERLGAVREAILRDLDR